MSYLIDTNVISEIIKKKPKQSVIKWFDSIPNNELYLSVITFGEIRKGIETIEDPQKKETLRVWLEHELPSWFDNRIISITKEISDRWGRLHAEIRRPIPAIDSLLAATALHLDLAIVTRNIKDFNYSALEIINPWDLK